MKKISIILMAWALVLSLSQCKKEQQASLDNISESVTITLDVKGGNGSRVDVDPSLGTVDFENGDVTYANCVEINQYGSMLFNKNLTGIASTVDEWKQWLADEYTASHPVVVWYVIDEPTTETTTAPTITPASGSNTLSVGTTLAPSEVSITGHIS